MALSRQKFADPRLQLFHDELAERVDGSPFTLNGREVSLSDVAVGTFTVWHRLDRTPKYWVVVSHEVDTLGAGTEHGVYYLSGDTKDKEKIVLRASCSFKKLTVWVA